MTEIKEESPIQYSHVDPTELVQELEQNDYEIALIIYKRTETQQLAILGEGLNKKDMERLIAILEDNLEKNKEELLPND